LVQRAAAAGSVRVRASLDAQFAFGLGLVLDGLERLRAG